MSTTEKLTQIEERLREIAIELREIAETKPENESCVRAARCNVSLAALEVSMAKGSTT